MTTIHLTDAQRDTFAACGLIVVDGEPCHNCDDGWLYDNSRNLVACPFCAEGWRILTEPCDTCEGRGFNTWTWDDDLDIRHVDSYDCPDCVGGRRVVTLTATCPTCDGTGKRTPLRDAGLVCSTCLARGILSGPTVVALGRFTIPALLTVSESSYEPTGVHVWNTGSLAIVTDGDPQHLGRTLSLDPLPRPGQFIARPEPVA